MEEKGRFILAPEYAGDFLGRTMGALVSSFSLFEAEKLSRYKIRHVNPRVRLKLDHGIDFLEGTALVDIDDTTWNWGRYLSEYRKYGCISLPDESRVFPSPAAVERLDRLLHLVKGTGNEEESRIEISFFDLMMFNLQEEIEAPPELRQRIESFYLGLTACI